MVLTLYFAMFLSFILGEMKERTEDAELSRLNINIDFYARSTYWDWIGIAFFIAATITAICAFRYFRHEKTEELNSIIGLS